MKLPGYSIEIYNDTRDREQVISLWKESLGYESAHNKPELSITKKTQLSDNLFFVALKNGKVIGTVMAGYDGHRGWIYSLAVKDEYRRNGLGTSLLRHAENSLIKLGCVKINLQILEENKNVEAFYLSNGFKTEKRISMGKIIVQNIEKAE